MQTSPLTPSIAVTIGRQTRLDRVFITTAAAALDALSTVTLYASTLAGVSRQPPTTSVRHHASTGARLVLVDATELP